MSNIDTCKECGKPLENTPSGLFSTCPIGHGKLMPPIMPKPFDRIEVPRSIAVCPECDGVVEVECNEWTMVDGVSRPTQGGLLIGCGEAGLLGWVSEEEEENEVEHAYRQCDWITVHHQIYKWVEAVQ